MADDKIPLYDLVFNPYTGSYDNYAQQGEHKYFNYNSRPVNELPSYETGTGAVQPGIPNTQVEDSAGAGVPSTGSALGDLAIYGGVPMYTSAVGDALDKGASFGQSLQQPFTDAGNWASGMADKGTSLAYDIGNKVGLTDYSSAVMPPSTWLDSGSQLVTNTPAQTANYATLFGDAPTFGTGAEAMTSGLQNAGMSVAPGTTASTTAATGGGSSQALVFDASGNMSSAPAGAVDAAAAQNASPWTAGSNIGAGVGSGIARFGIGLLSGEKPMKAAREGLWAGGGAYAGAAIGQTLIPIPGVGAAIGSVVGSTIGSIFCFAVGTPIVMEDGSLRPVEALRRGDRVALGGRVVARGEADASDLHLYRNVILSGGHAVFDNGVWRRVRDCADAFAIPEAAWLEAEVYPVVTENMLLVTPSFIAADSEEVDNAAGAYTDEDRIDLLNGDAERNARLAKAEKELCRVERVAA